MLKNFLLLVLVHLPLNDFLVLFLAVPLLYEDVLQGGVILSRDPSIGFNEIEANWAAALARIAESNLKNARLFGEQAVLLEQARELLNSASVD